MDEFKKKHPELFGIEAEHQEAVEHISNWDRIFKAPQNEDPRRAFEVQEALVSYPFNDQNKQILEMYYYENLPLNEIAKRVGKVGLKNPRSLIHRAKKAIMKHYKDVTTAPVSLHDYEIIDDKILQYGNERKRVVKLRHLVNGEIFWASNEGVKLDEDIQDLLDFSEEFDWDFMEIEGKNDKS